MNKKLFIYNTSWTVTSLLPVVKSWILAVVKIKDLVGLQQKMVTKNLANVRSDALRHLDFFLRRHFSLRRSCGATTRLHVLLGLINPRVRKIRNEVVYVRFFLIIVCLYICLCECLLYHNNHKTKHKNDTNCGSSFDLGASGLPYYCSSICVRFGCTQRASCMDSKPKKTKGPPVALGSSPELFVFKCC